MVTFMLEFYFYMKYMVLHCQISMELAFGYRKINYAKKSTPVTAYGNERQ